MAFATITTVAGAEKVTCQPGQSMECAFTVTSESGSAIHISLQTLAEGSTQSEWLEIVGERERGLPGSGSEHVTVRLSVPGDAAPGRYPFRLRAYVTDDPEQAAESPAIAAEVTEAAAPPSSRPPGKSGFPWWAVVVAVVVLLIGGGVAAWLLWPSDVLVPDVAKMSVEEAEKKLKGVGLEVGPIAERPTADQPPDRIVEQAPAAGETAAKGTEVVLTVAVPPPVDPVAEKKQKACNGYANSAVAQNKQNLDKKCGFTGRRWLSDRGAHFDWCMSGENYRTHAPRETSVRTASLQRCSTPAPASLIGSWKNRNADTRSVTRLEVKKKGRQVEVHAWGSCTPTDCDWGTTTGPVRGSRASVRWEQGFVNRTMKLSLQGSVLKMEMDSIYTDNRPRRKSTEYFVRK